MCVCTHVHIYTSYRVSFNKMCIERNGRGNAYNLNVRITRRLFVANNSDMRTKLFH